MMKDQRMWIAYQEEIPNQQYTLIDMLFLTAANSALISLRQKNTDTVSVSLYLKAAQTSLLLSHTHRNKNEELYCIADAC